ncbi:ABC transporter substrate-binding protein [candidate division KSB3 bacterium]|uniref:ABC transporter substrate-binding protein n=1 Tax=candidate division KSB3 bacterium TaxID=2044937 RepID=A0A2G6K7P8_9BACT|nr:MAG: ABC transporter substrate-binding protein [candidate division KSB3 bacterium]
MFKKFLPILLVVAMVVAFAGSALAEGEKIYFIVKATESDFWQIVIDGGRTAGEKFNVEFISQAPPTEADVAKQVAILETAIGDKPDAIVLAPTVEDALVPGIEKAMDAGIPVILIDSAASTDQYTSFLASDNVAIGTISADKLAAALEARTGKAAGKVAGITFMSGVGSLEKRKKGFMDQIKNYPDIEVVDFQDAQGKQGQTLAVVQNLMTTYPDLVGIYASNQYTGDETIRALDMAQKEGMATVVVDAGPLEIEGLKTGLADYMIVQQPWKMGYMGVEFALKAIKGESFEKFIDTGVVAITPEMMESGAAEEFLDPVAFNKKQ